MAVIYFKGGNSTFLMYLDLRNKMPNIRHYHFLPFPFLFLPSRFLLPWPYELAMYFVIKQELHIDFSAKGRNEAMWDEIACIAGRNACTLKIKYFENIQLLNVTCGGFTVSSVPLSS